MDGEKFPQINLVKPLNSPEQGEKKTLTDLTLPVIESHTPILPTKASGTGSIRLIYEMYNESFQIENGTIHTSTIDEEYALSFVMPECHIHLSEHPPSVKRELKNEGKNVYLHEDPSGTIVNLEANRDYYVYVTEAMSNLPTEVQTNVVSLPKIEKDDGRGFDSCTCIEGTPCVDEYGCRDWRQRYQIATANGWKGFGLEGSLE
ncbi:hypothetical protein THRCLA_10283 [Thraustotheca clavata]|uniref:Uncharacterized protein n=1 Tax=Thraustotheca clavata TaxID=74557 RepID=A0A1V9YSC2_9STRA|nr:hypothetical protein THRCLA_10283 [Thraustotheca clavata]